MTKDEIRLEDLIAETEQKILNNEYYEDTTVMYEGKKIGVRIRPLSQAKFIQITRNYGTAQSVAFNTDLLHECIINKYDNKQFTKQQINDLFTGGLAFVLAAKCLEISGITMDNVERSRQKKY